MATRDMIKIDNVPKAYFEQILSYMRKHDYGPEERAAHNIMHGHHYDVRGGCVNIWLLYWNNELKKPDHIPVNTIHWVRKARRVVIYSRAEEQASRYFWENAKVGLAQEQARVRQ